MISVDKLMYRLLIRKIRENNTLTKKEEAKRCANVIAFWAKEGDKYIRLLKKIKKEDTVSIVSFFRYLGYWYRFKLLCEGKEINLSKALPFDLEELNEFIASVKLLANE